MNDNTKEDVKREIIVLIAAMEARVEDVFQMADKMDPSDPRAEGIDELLINMCDILSAQLQLFKKVSAE